jgi:hypothetical protein
MRFFLMIVGAFAAIVCNERRADAQNESPLRLVLEIDAGELLPAVVADYLTTFAH